MNHQNRNGRGHNRPGTGHHEVYTIHDTDSEPEPEPKAEPEQEPEPVRETVNVRQEPVCITLSSDTEPEIENDPAQNQPGPSRAVNYTHRDHKFPGDPRRAAIPNNDSMDEDLKLELKDPDQPGPSSAFDNRRTPRRRRSRRQNRESPEDSRRGDPNQPGPSSAIHDSRSGWRKKLIPRKSEPVEDSRRTLTSSNDSMDYDDDLERGISDANQPGPSSAINLPSSSRSERREQSRPEQSGRFGNSRRAAMPRNDPMDDARDLEVLDSNQPGPSSAIYGSRSERRKQSSSRKTPLEDHRRALTSMNDPMDYVDDFEYRVPDSNQPGPSSAINLPRSSRSERREESRPEQSGRFGNSRQALMPRSDPIDDARDLEVLDANQPGPSSAINLPSSSRSGRRRQSRVLEDSRGTLTLMNDPMDDVRHLEVQDSNQTGPLLAINLSTSSRSGRRRQSSSRNSGPPEDSAKTWTPRYTPMKSTDSNQPGPSSAIHPPNSSRSGLRKKSMTRKSGPLEDFGKTRTPRNDPTDDAGHLKVQDSDLLGRSSAITPLTTSGNGLRKQSMRQKSGPREDSEMVLTPRNNPMDALYSNQPGPSSTITSSTKFRNGPRKQSMPQKSSLLEESEEALTPKNDAIDEDNQSEVRVHSRVSSLRKRRASNYKYDSEAEHSEGDDRIYNQGEKLLPVTELSKRVRRQKQDVQPNLQRDPEDVVDPRITAIRKLLNDGVYNDLEGPIDPGVHPPIGLGHTPYKLRKTMSRLQKEIADSEGFVSLAEHMKQDAQEDEDELRMMTEYRQEIMIGPEHQADLSKIEMITGNPDEYYGYEKEYEEVFWEPIAYDDHPTSEENMKKYIEETRDVYWRAIWRQFEGHIPYEYALQNLMKNRYRIQDGLETIDEYLLKLPQVLKPVCRKQARKIMREGLKDNLSLKKFRDSSMTNYFLNEVHNFHYQFIRFYILQPHHGVPCVCHQILCEPLDFEPRIGCSNCTRHFWNESSEPSTSSKTSRPQKLCLLCQTHERIGTGPRPVKNLILTDEEWSILEQWRREEQESGGMLILEDVMMLMEQKKMERWRLFGYDKEELSILNRNDVMGSKLGSIPEMLQPFRLPLFSRCGCSNRGIPTNLPPTLEGRKSVITGQGLPWLPEKEYHRQEDLKKNTTPMKKKRRSKKVLKN